MLKKKDITKKITSHLKGDISKDELSSWAYEQFQKEDAKNWYDPEYFNEIAAVIRSLIALDGGPEFDLTKNDFEDIIKILE